MRVAAVDIGTNTVRLLIADVTPDTPVQWRDHRTTVTRLGQGVDASSGLAVDAIDRTVAVLRDYGEAIRSWGCDGLRAVATSATRDAGNRDAFLDKAELALGARPEVISGDYEARLSFAGTTHALHGDGSFLVVDIGGGSTEFVLGAAEPEYAVSVDIGSVRLSERSLPDRPALKAQLVAARRHVDELLEAHLSLPKTPHTVLGVGGTFTSLVAIHLDLEVYDRAKVHGAPLGAVVLGGLADRFAAMSLAETEAIPSLDPARAQVLLGGAVVAERSLAHLGTAVTVSERDILDGIVLSLVDG